MQVKKYVVDSMSDALQKIRTDLGKNAIILNTKPIKTGGFLGMFRKKQIEVIAAVDPNETNEPERVKKAKTITPIASSISQPTLVSKKEENDPAAFSAVLQAATLQTRLPTQNEASDGIVSEVKAERKDGTVSQELKEMRSMLWKLVMTDENQAIVPRTFDSLRQRLQSQEVAEDILATIFERTLKELSTEALQDERKVSQKVKETIISLLNEASTEHGPIRETTSFVNIIGPTGVGKTTTLAKLAAEGVLTKQKKVGMMTSDTYRIAAVEQLKTYANILNVPLKVVYSDEELIPTMERLTGCDLIFMDTAGRNYRNKEYVDEINRLLRSPLSNETFLVLSITAKQKDMEAIIQSFENVRIDKVIFTKADETTTYGSILNLVIKHRLALSYFTTGQNVPDDIAVATPEKVAGLLLGEEYE
jgi:flagellar biosynthesis protein FlhF